MTDRHFDITPTWSGLLPILVELAAGKIDSSPEALAMRSTAWAELRRMASIADATSDDTRAYHQERGEALACGCDDFPTFTEWCQNAADPDTERARAEVRNELIVEGWELVRREQYDRDEL